ncbi:SDR family oxidoreductase [Mycobacteroides chelonae]|uniref:SDR family oxidoreductase n=1 Tax=Mycobacteroides chelonae TaxID=1774 RepID=UPI0009936147|nr:SDR family NAD(P)-dependent oxidoreductase [Mycobacteroides chelonae]
MNPNGRTAVVTGGGSGIGEALAHALVAAGARVVVADIDLAAAESVAAQLDTASPGAVIGLRADVSSEEENARIIAVAEQNFGPVDIFFANAGVPGDAGLDASDDAWRHALAVNVIAHVHAARLLAPGWIVRGEGYFVSTASAAGLLTQLGSATYSVSKHAAVAFAEWLAITHGDKGIKVSCICPMGVNTPLLDAVSEAGTPEATLAADAVKSAGAVLGADEVAAIILAGIAEERFLILPHPTVLDMFRGKSADYDGWLGGMRWFQKTLQETK